jgi:hypothetical protein
MPDREQFIPLDLSRFIEATRRAVYDAVVSIHFADPDHPAPYSPEEAGLLVFYVFGRWFATWLRLDEPAELPEHKRRELLRIQPDPRWPLGLAFYEA